MKQNFLAKRNKQNNLTPVQTKSQCSQSQSG